MKRTIVENKLSGKNIAKIGADETMSKSAKVRALFDGGMDIKEISTLLGIRYNFAYNVLQNHVMMNDIQVETAHKDTKRDEIVSLLKEGKSLADVSRATKTNYNYIWKISKELKTEQAKNVEGMEQAQ